jgi:1-phosphofructokinase
MIVTVTMNPAIDKTVEIERLLPGSLNRITRVEYDAGGKGINVSKTIRALGGESVAVGFLGGSTGKTIETVLTKEGICHDFVRVEGETRTNTKVFEKNGAVTELNEPGPVVSREHQELLMEKLAGYAGGETLFVLSGSVPACMDKGIYARIIRMVHEKGAKVLLDADGELFANAVRQRPELVKPNVQELMEYAGLAKTCSRKEVLAAARSIRESGVERAVVSMGAEGALFLFGDCGIFSPALPVKAHSTVGAGDAMAAALAYGFTRKLDAKRQMRLCMAAAAGAVTTVGTKPPGRELVGELMRKVVLEKMEEESLDGSGNVGEN